MLQKKYFFKKPMSLIAKLVFILGTMNTGKSTLLLQKFYELKQLCIPTVLFTSHLDDRYKVGQITSRAGLKKQANTYKPKFSFIQYVKKNEKIRYLLIDEGQFLSKEQVNELAYITYKYNIYIMVFGLKNDYQGNLFEGSSQLLSMADEIIELPSFCSCGKRAKFNIRINQNKKEEVSQQILIGGDNMYKPTCYEHFLQHNNIYKHS